MSKTTTVSKTRMLAEAAVMLALGIVLSLIKLLDLPYGGSITVACMLPVIIIAYRHGTRIRNLAAAAGTQHTFIRYDLAVYRCSHSS